MRTFLTKLWDARRVIAVYFLLFSVGLLGGELIRELAVPDVRPANEPFMHRLIVAALLVFILAAAVPFVPGAEIGFALLFIFGSQAALIVYIGMVGALMLSYAVARVVPKTALLKIAQWLGLKKLSAVIEDHLCLTPQECTEDMFKRIKGPLGKFALRNRYLVLIALLNTPGNSLLGGGGGLAFFAGSSRLYRVGPFVLSVLIAVAPVPLIFYLSGF